MKLFTSADANRLFTGYLTASPADVPKALALLETSARSAPEDKKKSAGEHFIDCLKEELAEVKDEATQIALLKAGLESKVVGEQTFNTIMSMLRYADDNDFKTSLIALLITSNLMPIDRLIAKLVDLEVPLSPNPLPNILQATAELSPKAQLDIFNILIKNYIKKGNANSLHSLRESDPLAFETAMKNRDLISEKEKSIVTHCLSLDSYERSILTRRMSQFVNGYGNIDEEGARITCAQISSRKSTYHFKPTVLNHEQLETYFELLKGAPRPVSKIFIVEGTHWYSGKIEIDRAGKVNILFIDPAAGASKYPQNVNNGIMCAAHVFPAATVYASSSIRQRSKLGCSIFAIDDARHLATADKYLGEEFKETGVFGYLAVAAGNTTSTITNTEYSGPPITVTNCHLPMSLERTMQSRQLLTEVLPRRPDAEQKRPVNKKGETSEASIRKHLLAADLKAEPTAPESKERNVRIDYVLSKFGVMNLDFLIKEKDEERLQAMMDEHSLAGFMKELLEAESLTEPAPTTPISVATSSSEAPVLDEAKIQELQLKFNSQLTFIADTLIRQGADESKSIVTQQQLMNELKTIFAEIESGIESPRITKDPSTGAVSFTPSVAPSTASVPGVISAFLYEAVKLRSSTLASNEGKITGEQLQAGFEKAFFTAPSVSMRV